MSRPENKDTRYTQVRQKILSGKIIHLLDIFEVIPVKVVAADLKIPLSKLETLLCHPGKFTLEIMIALSGLINIELEKIDFFVAQYHRDILARRVAYLDEYLKNYPKDRQGN